MGAHGYFLQLQGGKQDVVDALGRGDLANAAVDDRTRKLLEFVEKITRSAYRVTDSDVESLRCVGWSDSEVAEAVYITALFAFFNRVADTFGLADPGYGEISTRGEAIDSRAHRKEHD